MNQDLAASVIQGPYFNDLMGQPEALRSLAGAMAGQNLSGPVSRELTGGRLKRVVLTGMGSSLHALYPLHLCLTAKGYISHHVEAAELLLGHDPLFDSSTLLVAVSQSGESAEIVRLMERAEAFGQVIGITNREESALGRHSESCLPLHAGEEATVSCKTYLNTLAQLNWLARKLTGENPDTVKTDLENMIPKISHYLDRWKDHMRDLETWIEGVECVFVAGRGVSLATAGTGGLILKEATRRPAEGMSSAAFRHGPLEMADAKSFLLVFAGDANVAPLNRRLVDAVRKQDGRAVLVEMEDEPSSGGVFQVPAAPVSWLPLVEILAVQMVSLAIAARDSVEAGYFHHAAKITTVE